MSRRSALEVQAARAFALKNYARAIERLNDLLALVGENPHTLYLLALCHSRQNDDLEALDFARRALGADAGHLESLKLLGRIHFLRGEHGEARDYVARALQLDRDGARDGEAPRSWLSALTARLGRRPTRASDPLDAREHRQWRAWAESFMAAPPDTGGDSS
jgi:tetratricopeptide (TPR) repeat protein